MTLKGKTMTPRAKALGLTACGLTRYPPNPRYTRGSGRRVRLPCLPKCENKNGWLNLIPFRRDGRI